MSVNTQKIDKSVFVPQNNRLDNYETQLTIQTATLLDLADKVADVTKDNEGAALIVASAIGTSMILYVIAKSAAKLIVAFRDNSK